MKKWWNILQNHKRIQLALCGLLCGLILILWGNSRQTETAQTERGSADSYFAVERYTENLEKRIAALCTEMESVSEAHVLLTLDGSSEMHYGDDGESGTWLSASNSSGDTLIQEIYPRIRGVAIVCSRGNDPEIRLKITELVSAALGISTSRVFVTGK